MTTPAAPKPDDTQVVIGIIFERMAALEARVTELETPPEPEPDEYQARLTLNTADEADRPQALANLNAAKARIRRQAFTAADLETPDWCAACGNIAVAWPGVVCDICQNEAKS